MEKPSNVLQAQARSAISNQKKLRPLNDGEQRNNADGTHSTELLIAEILDPETGESIVVPSLWKGAHGLVELSPDESIAAAIRFERETGNKFPRFKSIDDAVGFSKSRSGGGGNSAGPLFKPGRGPRGRR